MNKKIKREILQYTAIFESAEEGGFTVTIPSLPGCVTEGDTFEEARDNIQEAAKLYIEVMLKHKEKPELFIDQQPIITPIQVAV